MTESSIQNLEGIWLSHPLLGGFGISSPTSSQAPQKNGSGPKISRTGLTPFSPQPHIWNTERQQVSKYTGSTKRLMWRKLLISL